VTGSVGSWTPESGKTIADALEAVLAAAVALATGDGALAAAVGASAAPVGFAAVGALVAVGTAPPEHALSRLIAPAAPPSARSRRRLKVRSKASITCASPQAL
jgi:hypothetical protein